VAHNPIIIGAGCAVYGAILGFSAADRFKSPTFDLQFQVMPRPVWAVAFIASGILAASVRHWTSAVFLVAVLGSWVVGLIRGVLTGVATGPGGWVPWVIVIVCLITSYVRIGVERR
jgi:sterol desaturase/sphingolipid hydroxylase (fatty acid hydroxylase superfamily)